MDLVYFLFNDAFLGTSLVLAYTVNQRPFGQESVPTVYLAFSPNPISPFESVLVMVLFLKFRK